jgi:uncharacterized repeat protein (TIGR03943 family)
MRLSRFLNQILAPLTLFEWGGLLTYFFLIGRIAAFLHPIFWPLVLLAGLLLLVSAACLVRSSRQGDVCCCSPGESKPSPFRRLAIFAMLILPIAAAAALSPDRFSNAFTESRGLASPGPSGVPTIATLLALPSVPQSTPPAFVPLPASTQPRPVGMLDLMFAARDEWCQKDFEGRPLELIGRYYPDNPHYFGLVTTVITCCALDAQTLAVRVETQSAPNVEKLSWVKVVGAVRFEQSEQGTVPILTAESVTHIPSPADPYIYRPATPSRRNRSVHH